MNTLRNERLTANAKTLRKNMTKEERHLWYDFLKQLPVTVNRQKVIGPYIVDFYCAEAKLVIEVDGSQHYEDTGAQADRERDAFLRQQGLQVVRYSNFDIRTDFEAVCQDIYQRLPLEPKLSDKDRPARKADEVQTLCVKGFPLRGSCQSKTDLSARRRHFGAQPLEKRRLARR